ncbi:uncharacterized protein MELLADRAFT_105661 [Melampsora larici-populina 98AG31]|uniref:Uncharacterized protein n=1 Tax=Melampsora larici-populina (strain 98AG31 / pathotype 3-4-7) TaxID=747676 RepID=F4RIY5_MELLP|nr:uncharacterized protein MELLADRAFT_105661 [Melampsora larici-populina 98AG31]EGG07749.1 hypothetical protein MELLADRAFT_105661 [Melampsora larici-populina 98AG31]
MNASFWSEIGRWNNVRYTIETGLLIANLLGRELVLPGFSYASACAYDIEVCEKLTPMYIRDKPVDLTNVVNRSQYPDPDDGKTFLLPPLQEQNPTGWVLPLESQWDSCLTHREFLQLTGAINESHYPSFLGQSTGKWSVNYNKGLSYRKVPNQLFTNINRTMVDRLPDPVAPLGNSTFSSVPPSVLEKCRITLQKVQRSEPVRPHKKRVVITYQDHNTFPSWNDDLINNDQMSGDLSIRDHDFLERCLASGGYRTAYGYTLLGYWMKAPYDPTKYIRKVQDLTGWWDELNDIEENILHIEGEIHNGFPPGSMLWTSLAGRQNYENLVRTAIKAPDVYDRMASKLERKMRERCEGRSWRSTHMRRGDFVNYGWAISDIGEHYALMQKRLNASLATLEASPALLISAHKAYGTSRQVPKLEDPIYLATNAKGPELDFLRKQNVILLNDLLDDSDRIELSFSSHFQDTLAILEQCLMMRSAIFIGDYEYM